MGHFQKVWAITVMEWARRKETLVFSQAMCLFVHQLCSVVKLTSHYNKIVLFCFHFNNQSNSRQLPTSGEEQSMHYTYESVYPYSVEMILFL